jgi:hypothetical protein
MMSLKAKFEMVLPVPDKKPLPNLVIQDAIVEFMPLEQT